MAVPRKPSSGGAARSRRKSTGGRKTKQTKTKITKGPVKSIQTQPTSQRTAALQEMVMTSRRERVAEKARQRSEARPQEVVVPEIQAMKITDVSGVVYDKADYDAMVEMYDSTIRDIKEGEIVAGRVLGVTPDDIIVDVGFKSEGLIPIEEFPRPINIAVGEEIEVFLEQIEDSHGQLILSKQKADFMRVWDRIRDVHDAGGTIEGRVARRIKGGVVVDLMGVDAFLPGSQISLRQVPDFDASPYPFLGSREMAHWSSPVFKLALLVCRRAAFLDRNSLLLRHPFALVRGLELIGELLALAGHEQLRWNRGVAEAHFLDRDTGLGAFRIECFLHQRLELVALVNQI